MSYRSLLSVTVLLFSLNTHASEFSSYWYEIDVDTLIYDMSLVAGESLELEGTNDEIVEAVAAKLDSERKYKRAFYRAYDEVDFVYNRCDFNGCAQKFLLTRAARDQIRKHEDQKAAGALAAGLGAFFLTGSKVYAMAGAITTFSVIDYALNAKARGNPQNLPIRGHTNFLYRLINGDTADRDFFDEVNRKSQTKSVTRKMDRLFKQYGVEITL